MAGFEMAPTNIDEVGALRRRLAEVEEELQRHTRANEERLYNFVDSLPVMVWVAGTDALCTFFNRAWLEFRGRSMDEEAGNGWTEGLHPDDRDLCLETYLKAFTARIPFRVQYRLQRGGGGYTWVEDSGVPRTAQTGDFEGFVGTAIDISDRKRNYFTPDEESVRLVFSLTERERQVLVLIADGKSTKEAAARLGISYKTADSHRSRILENLGVHETASMVRYAIRAGLVQP